jgi:RNA polymerase sigma factor (TIGR02999 family)
MADVTRILNAIQKGDGRATDELLPLVYEELRLLAAQKLSQEQPDQTLQATALAHEAYLRLVGAQDKSWDNKGHFFKAAAEAMRRILIDNARRKKSLKRKGRRGNVEFIETDLPIQGASDDGSSEHCQSSGRRSHRDGAGRTLSWSSSRAPRSPTFAMRTA